MLQSMCGDQKLGRYYTHMQDDLNLHILCMFEGTLSLAIAHINCIDISCTCIFDVNNKSLSQK